MASTPSNAARGSVFGGAAGIGVGGAGGNGSGSGSGSGVPALAENGREGYLYKKGGFVTNWKKRWVRLTFKPMQFQYFNSKPEKGSTPIDTVPTTGGLVVSDASYDKDRPFKFCVQTKSRTWWFAAENDVSLNEWLASFQHAATLSNAAAGIAGAAAAANGGAGAGAGAGASAAGASPPISIAGSMKAAPAASPAGASGSPEKDKRNSAVLSTLLTAPAAVTTADSASPAGRDRSLAASVGVSGSGSSMSGGSGAAPGGSGGVGGESEREQRERIRLATAKDERRQAMRNRTYQKMFRLPRTESLLEDYSCAVKKTILLSGRIYVSKNYICFLSSIFGSKTELVLPVDDITGVEEANIAYVIPNSIKVFTKTEMHFFASFFDRDHCFQLMRTVLQERDRHRAAAHANAANANANATAAAGAGMGAAALAAAASRNAAPSAQLKAAAKGAKKSGAGGGEDDVEIGDESDAEDSDGGGSGSSAGASPSPAASATPAALTVTPKHAPKLSASLPFGEHRPPAPDAKLTDDAKLEMKVVLDITLPIHALQFYELFLSDSASFSLLDMHKARGDTEMNASAWKEGLLASSIASSMGAGGRGGNGSGSGDKEEEDKVVAARDFCVRVPVKGNPFGPDTTRVHKVQRYHVSFVQPSPSPAAGAAGGRARHNSVASHSGVVGVGVRPADAIGPVLEMDTASVTPDLPFGDCFHVRDHWLVWNVTQPTPLPEPAPVATASPAVTSPTTPSPPSAAAPTATADASSAKSSPALAPASPPDAELDPFAGFTTGHALPGSVTTPSGDLLAPIAANARDRAHSTASTASTASSVSRVSAAPAPSAADGAASAGPSGASAFGTLDSKSAPAGFAITVTAPNGAGSPDSGASTGAAATGTSPTGSLSVSSPSSAGSAGPNSAPCTAPTSPSSLLRPPQPPVLGAALKSASRFIGTGGSCRVQIRAGVCFTKITWKLKLLVDTIKQRTHEDMQAQYRFWGTAAQDWMRSAVNAATVREAATVVPTFVIDEERMVEYRAALEAAEAAALVSANAAALAAGAGPSPTASDHSGKAVDHKQSSASLKPGGGGVAGGGKRKKMTRERSMATDNSSLSPSATAAAMALDPKPKAAGKGQALEPEPAPARAGASGWGAKALAARNGLTGALRGMGWTRAGSAADFALSVPGLMVVSLAISLGLLMWLYGGLRGASDSPTADAVACLSRLTTGGNATTLGTAVLGVGCGLLLCALCSVLVYAVSLRLHISQLNQEMAHLRVRLDDVQIGQRQLEKSVSDALARGTGGRGGGQSHLYDISDSSAVGSRGGR